MKFVFDKLFKFADFPAINQCHNKYNDLLDLTYDMEAKYESGNCSKDDWGKAIDNCEAYYIGEYAKTVYATFYGKGLLICNWRTKKEVAFEEVFSCDFQSLGTAQKKDMVGLVEGRYGWKLPSEFYGR